MPDQSSYTIPADIRLICLDVDGTIVNSRGEISQSDRVAVLAAQNAGIKVSLVTGRPHFACRSVIDALKINEACVFCSGALILNPATEQTIYSATIPTMVVERLLTLAAKYGIQTELYAADRHFVEDRNTLSEIHWHHYLHQPPHIAPFKDVLNKERIIKGQFMLHTGSDHSALQDIVAQMPKLEFASAPAAQHPEITFVNISMQEASRRKAFPRLTNALDVTPQQVIAFGDGNADIPFIECAGLGIAMGNAGEAVRAAADLITLTVDESGVADVIRKIPGIDMAGL